ncbi:DUF222 domain-containing protein [Microbacterium sp. NPDC077184]|uniref:HNH endonuclease signature motif containing protein n=1 Tax=Microbacterium sp. NPDC077184 TaxID=3154764 RepID=UPI0034197C62
MDETPDAAPEASWEERTAAHVDECVAWHRLEAIVQAGKARALAAAQATALERMAESPSAQSRAREMPIRGMAAELGAALRVNDRSVQTQMDQAHRLCTEYPATWSAWKAGRIDRSHTRVIVDTGAAIRDPEARAAYERDVLDYAVKTTPGRVRPYAQQVADKHHPRTMQERHDEALPSRRVWVEDLDDGLSMLGMIGPSTEIHGAYDRATQQAKALKGHDLRNRRDAAERATIDSQLDGTQNDSACTWFDDRTRDQMRVDIILDMLLTAAPSVDPTGGDLGAIRGVVQVTIPATTLTGTTTGGAELNGKCAIDPTTVRTLTGTATGFDRVFLHPVTGAVLTVDRYTPNAALKRLLLARDVRCAFPGCRHPALRSEIDHRKEHAKGGTTDEDNLGPFCLRHHTVKHTEGWTVTQLPGGRLHFTAPSGKTYTEDPPPRVMFLPEPQPASAPF